MGPGLSDVPRFGSYVGGGVGVPCFGAIEDIVIAVATRDRLHAVWVGAVVGFGEPETTHPLARRYTYPHTST